MTWNWVAFGFVWLGGGAACLVAVMLMAIVVFLEMLEKKYGLSWGWLFVSFCTSILVGFSILAGLLTP